MAKDVTIRDENGRICGRFARLSTSANALKDACAQYGLGQYRVSWSEMKNVTKKNGEKGRRSVSVNKWIRVYDVDGANHTPQTFETPQAYSGTVNSELVGILASVKSGMDALNNRLAEIEAGKEDDYDDEEDEEDAPKEDMKNDFFSLVRKPEYAPLVDVVITSASDPSALARRIDLLISENPGLIRSVLIDILAIITSKI